VLLEQEGQPQQVGEPGLAPHTQHRQQQEQQVGAVQRGRIRGESGIEETQEARAGPGRPLAEPPAQSHGRRRPQQAECGDQRDADGQEGGEQGEPGVLAAGRAGAAGHRGEPQRGEDSGVQ